MTITAKELKKWYAMTDLELETVFKDVYVEDFSIDDKTIENRRLIKLFWKTKI